MKRWVDDFHYSYIVECYVPQEKKHKERGKAGSILGFELLIWTWVGLTICLLPQWASAECTTHTVFKVFWSSFWTFLFVHWVNSCFCMVNCSSSIYFCSLVKAYWRAEEKLKSFARRSNIFSPFAEIYWSVGEDILKNYSRVLYNDLNKTPICFHLHRWENAKCDNLSEGTSNVEI